MRRFIFLAGLALAVGVLLPGSAVAGVGGSDLPFKGTASGYGTTNLLTGEHHNVLTGPVSHFGLSSFEQQGQLAPTGPGTFDWFGTWTLTAANGDQMVGTSTGTVSFAADGVHSTFVGNYVSSGGTGRFGDATLTFGGTAEGSVLSVDGVIANVFFEGTVVGTLSY